MTSHAIKKPILFISHATTDAEFANAVKDEIEKVFANGVSVFCTSSPGAIPPGADWLGDIEGKLGTAQAVIALITPTSIERPWLWFEIGATWGKSREGQCRIYPLCVSEIELSDLPAPLDRLQALSLGRAADLEILFKALAEQFGFGNLKAFRASNITKRVPKYSKVEVKEIDRVERVFYSGKYTGYSDDDLMEVIDTHIFRPDYETFRKYSILHEGREELVFNGKLIHFRRVERELDLPPGSARRLVPAVAQRYSLVPSYLTEHLVRFELEREDAQYEEEEKDGEEEE